MAGAPRLPDDLGQAALAIGGQLVNASYGRPPAQPRALALLAGTLTAGATAESFSRISIIPMKPSAKGGPCPGRLRKTASGAGRPTDRGGQARQPAGPLLGRDGAGTNRADPAQAVPPLIALLSDPDNWGNRQVAGSALAKIGRPAAKDAVPLDMHVDAGQLDDEEPDDLVIGGSWRPRNEFAHSRVLDEIYKIAHSDEDSPLADAEPVLSLAYGALAIRWLPTTLDP